MPILFSGLFLLLAPLVAAEFLIYLYPAQFERDGVLSTWYSQLYTELGRHPYRTADAHRASVFFLGIDVSCAYLYPVYAAPAPGSVNYVQEGRFGPLGDAKVCRDTRKARLEAYIRNGWAPFWGVPGKQHIVFDQLCYHPLMELVNANHFVTLAGVGHLKGRAYGYRRHIDISWPEMPVTVDGDGDLGPCDCGVRPRLVSFQGAGTRKVRETLQKLHDGQQVVVNVVDVSKSSLNTTDARWNVSHPIKQPYATLMKESDFALAPAGHTQCSLRLYEIMSFCTIPVVLADDKLLPFSEILNWSEMAVLVPEKEALSIPERLRNISVSSRCSMRRKAHEAFQRYFANVTANIRGLLEVLQNDWQRGFGPNEDSRRLEQEFQHHSWSLSWSQPAQEDFYRHSWWLTRLLHGADLDQDNDCKISLEEVLIHFSAAHDAGVESLARWAISAVAGPGRISASWEQLSREFKAFKGSSSKDELKEMLRRRDVDGNGELSLQEAREPWNEALELLELLVTSAFHHLDADRDHYLSFTEFGAAQDSEKGQGAALEFSKLDFNNDSHIALRELLWPALLSRDVRRLALKQGFALADEDADGRLSGAEMERSSAQQLLHLLRDFPTSSTPATSSSAPCGAVHRGGGAVDAKGWAEELRKCGFVHLSPGIFPKDFVTTASDLAARSNCSDRHLWKEELGEPEQQLLMGLQEVTKPTKCCDLIALQLSCFGEEDVAKTSPVGSKDHYVVLLMLEAVTVPVMGFIAEERHEREIVDERNNFCAGDVATGLRSRDGYVARYLSAGSVLIYDANLVKRRFLSSLGRQPMALRYDFLAVGDEGRLQGLRARAGTDEQLIQKQQLQLETFIKEHQEL